MAKEWHKRDLEPFFRIGSMLFASVKTCKVVFSHSCAVQRSRK